MVKQHPIPCTKAEIDSILETAQDNDFYYTLFMVAKSTGRRLGEYYDVKAKDVKETEQGIKVMTTKVLKRRKKVEKDAILSEEVYRLLTRWIRQNDFKLEDYIFRKVGMRQIQYKITLYAKKAGVPHHVSFHNFRHYFITALIKQNWSYDKIAKLTGHSSVGTLAVYDHVLSTDISKDALEALKNI